ncbi:hypothetical protein P692DRAFT_20733068 [Suillus brevipes Sb2]|nr:hypothetical protein P692DRAFT_20733068 [Suillus brevipes Sb2]
MWLHPLEIKLSDQRSVILPEKQCSTAITLLSVRGWNSHQAALGPLAYHYWHSPINGRVIETVLVPATSLTPNSVSSWSQATFYQSIPS